MTAAYWTIILNYKHWRETAACAQSLLAGTLPPQRLVICDNGSDNDSLEQLELWARAKGESCLRLTRNQVETGDGPGDLNARVLLVDNAANLGYAAGNNVGLRLFLKSNASHVWVLNNDTLIARDCAEALTRHMADNPRVGLCGTLTRYMDQPKVVQCRGGGWYSLMWGIGGLYGDGDVLARGELPKEDRPLQYVNGASVFVRREFLEDVGLMEEAYFLYCEEIDWALRARNRWGLGWCPHAEIFHHEGLTTGISNRRGLGRTLSQTMTLTRSRLLLTWKFIPWALPTVLAGQAARILVKQPLSLWRSAFGTKRHGGTSG